MFNFQSSIDQILVGQYHPGPSGHPSSEPRSGGISLATGVSRWIPDVRDKPRSGGSLEVSRLRRSSISGMFSTGSRRWLEKCRRYAALRRGVFGSNQLGSPPCQPILDRLEEQEFDAEHHNQK